MLQACPSFKSDESRGEDDKSAGSLRHAALACALAGDMVPLQSLDDDEASAVEWALEYIKVHSPEGCKMWIEQRIIVVGDDFETITEGTPDVVCGAELFDLKWRERDYKAQMAAYALGRMLDHGFTAIRCHVLFAERKHAEMFTITFAEAEALVKGIIANAGTATNACDYCGWCANRLTCPALLQPALQVVKARDEVSAEDKKVFEDWVTGVSASTSKITDAKVMGIVLKVVRQCLQNFCDGAEYRAKEMLIKEGLVADGFRAQTRQGGRTISSVTDAFARAGLPQDDFLALCEIKFSGLVENYASANGMKKAQAERTVEEKLGDIITRKPSTVSLVAVKNANDK